MEKVHWAMKDKYMVVMAGALDYFQIPVAIAEAGGLARLITDIYTPDSLDGRRFLPGRLAELAWRRRAPGLSSRLVTTTPGHALRSAVGSRYPWLAPSMDTNEAVGAHAAQRFLNSGASAALIYFGYWPSFLRSSVMRRNAITAPLFIVQNHPVPSQVRSVLRDDRRLTGIPDDLEFEESMDEADVDAYEDRLRQADGVLAGSSFVRDGLIEIGVDSARIQVVPYGGFPNDPRRAATDRSVLSTEWSVPSAGEPLRLLWVGGIVYRKGAHHLAEALRHLPFPVKLTVVARRVRSVNPFMGLPMVSFKQDVSPSELAGLYASHDLFCLPSLAEGFGLVVAEALGRGLPVLATTSTGARDIVAPGVNGIVVNPGNADVLGEAISRLHADRRQLVGLHEGARKTASDRAWSRYREHVVDAVGNLEDAYQELGPTPKSG